ncbi:hypothetical protein [Microbacterium maritypicum]|uniref:hypothetical protein n=1 Tax=Microbacterium maritypicum TaxID=33918 RepID=UPI003A90C442
MTDPTPSVPVGGGNPPDAERPGTERADAKRPDTERPDMESAHVIARHGDPSVGRTPAPAGHPDTHVEWVRPTDMAARAGARVMEKTADVNQDVHELVRQASRDGAARIRRALSHREADLVPDVPTSPAQPVLGRQGVSR